MEEQCSPLSWAYYFQEEGVEELKQSLLYSTLELEAAVIAAHEEISRKDDEILQLKGLLAKIIKERDEFHTKYQQVSLEKQMLFQQVQIQAHSSKQQLDCPISSGTTSNEDDNNALSPSDCDDNIVVATSGCKDTLPLTPSRPPDVIDRVPIKKELPEQGKFLQAVMEAGPLLQTLLLAGPLPQWQHPPPQLNSVDIPPVTMSSSPRSKLISPTTSGGFTNKRGMLNMEPSDFSPTSKYQKVCSPILIDHNIII
ncbi:hypothetical protein C2S53_017868 [Perilla frutescens var. hirtella]|uniref:Uncharacterized protein n=1 Tax=Perilla frutescens var. hirtella TaxID=608512 RepID=A0AAD4JQS4_PERFH|nr:hypothetical protein C2S53_017868 [Perilla frutescens var. hirtella]